MFHHFPLNFVNGLRLALTGCDKQCIPVQFFNEISRRLIINALIEEDTYSGSESIYEILKIIESNLEITAIMGNKLTLPISKLELKRQLLNYFNFFAKKKILGS